mgnify:FL=1
MRPSHFFVLPVTKDPEWTHDYGNYYNGEEHVLKYHPPLFFMVGIPVTTTTELRSTFSLLVVDAGFAPAHIFDLSVYCYTTDDIIHTDTYPLLFLFRLLTQT